MDNIIFWINMATSQSNAIVILMDRNLYLFDLPANVRNRIAKKKANAIVNCQENDLKDFPL